MPMNIGITGFVIIVLIALLLFGPSKLPQLGRAIGSTVKEFRKGTKELMDEDLAERKNPSKGEL